MDKNPIEPVHSHLEHYLNDHYAGSAGAVDLIQALIDHSESAEDRHFFSELKIRVEEDRLLLRELLEKIGYDPSIALAAAGKLTAKVSRLKLMWEGMEPGHLGMFEALEMLALGIQGKRLLWRILGKAAAHVPEWEGVDFAALEHEAVRQLDAVEERRVEAGLAALVDGKQRDHLRSGVP